MDTRWLLCIHVCCWLLISKQTSTNSTIITGREKGNRKRGSKPYLFSVRAPDTQHDKLVVTFS